MANLITASRSSKNVEILSLLTILFGWAGIHYFYLGRYGRGIFYMLTLGLFGYGWLIDSIWAMAGKMYDGQGKRVMNKLQATIYNEQNTIYTD
jgi:restriction system protein